MNSARKWHVNALCNELQFFSAEIFFHYFDVRFKKKKTNKHNLTLVSGINTFNLQISCSHLLYIYTYISSWRATCGKI